MRLKVNIESIQYWGVLLYVLLLPFEQLLFGGLTIGKISALLICIPFLLRPVFRINGLNSIIIFIFLYLLWSTIISFVYSDIVDDVYVTLFQNILLFIIIISVLSKSSQRCKGSFIALGLGGLFLSIRATLGIGVSYDLGGRITLGDFNANSLGLYAVLSSLLFTPFLLDYKNTLLKRIICFCCLLPLINLIALSASKGAFFAFFISVIFAVFSLKVPIKYKLKMYVYAFVTLLVVSFILLNSQVMGARMSSFVKQGDVARNEIWNVAFNIFEENPLAGVGPVIYREMVTKAYGKMADTHNVYLYILVSSGIIGLFLFMSFVILSMYKLVKNRTILPSTVLPCFFILLFNWSKGGGTLYSKYSWFLLAYCLSTYVNYKRNDKIL